MEIFRQNSSANIARIFQQQQQQQQQSQEILEVDIELVAVVVGAVISRNLYTNERAQLSIFMGTRNQG